MSNKRNPYIVIVGRERRRRTIIQNVNGNGGLRKMLYTLYLAKCDKVDENEDNCLSEK